MKESSHLLVVHMDRESGILKKRADRHEEVEGGGGYYNFHSNLGTCYIDDFKGDICIFSIDLQIW